MKLIVGLGNPGKTYERTRHNAGFMAVDALAREVAPGEPVRAKFSGDLVEASLGGEKCLILKPMTYMNRSGAAVGEAVRFYKLLPATDLLVVTDDIYLPVGALRLRAEGGDGGHNGLLDVARALGSNAYPRLRIGAGEKPPFMDQADWVLSRFTEDEWPVVDESTRRAAKACLMFAREGLAKAMNTFNSRPGAERPRPRPSQTPETPGVPGTSTLGPAKPEEGKSNG